MIQERLNKLKKKLNLLNLDGYVIPKNDDFFSEYSQKDRLKIISNFTGSAGYAVILKNKNYLFVDGRYSIQAKIESGKLFKIKKFQDIFNCSLFKGLKLGMDPKIFTSKQIHKFFTKFTKIELIDDNLIDQIYSEKLNITKPFYSIDEKFAGEGFLKKINRTLKIMKKENSDYLFISAPENIAWLLNIRGFDNPNSPIPNCRLLLTKNKKFFLISERYKTKRLIKEKKINEDQVVDPSELESFLVRFKNGKIIIDNETCSIYFEKILRKKFKILNNKDPIYLLKAVKNKKEINGMIDSHILDGAALTKFLYWIKVVNKKKISEVDAQNKLEKFRKKNKQYIFPSFNTIAGAGKNAAIVHYRATQKSSKIINKEDIFLCDSGGQYRYGTTDVTRTVCFSEPKKKIKNIFTKVLKGHIAVATSDLKIFYNGKLIDVRARKNLKKSGLDYQHGTGHGVGFFLNVHEGPQAISKFNKIKLREGMILSNEPGYYKKGKFGIRIENLVYIKKYNNKLSFENLTLAPIDKDLINFELLNKEEKNYLFQYHVNVYSKLSKYLNRNEKKWLTSFF